MFRGVLALISLLACGCSPYRLPPESSGRLPARLSELGGTADLRAYRPSFALWSDGASKKRWIRLPRPIDSSNMESWRFPVGTELWKEFSIDGKKIETRVLRRVGTSDDAWEAMTYAWNAAQTDAFAAPAGVENALGTHYDIPSARTCMVCHGGRAERVLGFSAVQLAHESKDDWTLDGLVAEGRLTVTPAAPIRVPGSSVEVAAIGYLHANCSHCHNGVRPADARFYRPPASIDLGLRVQDLGAVESTRAWVTTANPSVKHLIGQRMTHGSAFVRRMPPLATKLIDAEGVAVVRGWLDRR